MCVCIRVCLLTEWGFGERQPPEWEQIGVWAFMSWLINLLFNSWPHRRLNTCTLTHTRIHKHTHAYRHAHAHTQSLLQGPKAAERVHTDTLVLAQTRMKVATDGKFNILSSLFPLVLLYCLGSVNRTSHWLCFPQPPSHHFSLMQALISCCQEHEVNWNAQWLNNPSGNCCYHL